MKKQAVLDTSFWSCAVHVSIHGYLNELFGLPVWVPPMVEEEILDNENVPPSRIYVYQKEYNLEKTDGRLIRKAPDESLDRLGDGEREAISLAHEENAALLINETAGYRKAKDDFELVCFTVPLFVVQLVRFGILGAEAGKAKVEDCRAVTSDRYIDDALSFIEEEKK